MKHLAAMIALLLFSATASAAELKCTEIADPFGNDLVGTDVGTVTIAMDKNGNAESIAVKRVALGELSDLDISFSRSKGDRLIHDIENTEAKSIDEETGDEVFAGDIRKFEVISGENRKGQKVTVKVDDHYGPEKAGSNLVLELNGITYDTSQIGSVFHCEGTKRFPLQ